MDLSPVVIAELSLVLAALTGALVGTAGFALLVSGRQTRRIARLLARLAEADDPVNAVDPRGVRDGALRASLDTLATRLASTWRLATIDHLTGVLSRQALLARLGDELERGARYGRPVAIVLVDLDHFKRINDAHGHAAGDEVLRAVAEVLGARIRAVDAVGRYGGEEFMLVLPETTVEDAVAIAEKLRRVVATTSVDVGDGTRVELTLSAGVAGATGGRHQLDALIGDADVALYAAKSLGRDQVQAHREVSDEDQVARASIAPEARVQASELGRTAARAATEVLVDVLSGRASWATQPSTLIAEAAATLARSIGLPDREVERVRAAGLLHDLGNLAIPDDILSHPGELGTADRRVLAEHPKIGQVILEQAGALRDASAIVLHHHEWFDGRGYPHGLVGDEIPIGARIVAVIDAYEAMTVGRPYRPAISHESAVAELRALAGAQFDPGVVEAFVGLYGAGLPVHVVGPADGHAQGGSAAAAAPVVPPPGAAGHESGSTAAEGTTFEDPEDPERRTHGRRLTSRSMVQRRRTGATAKRP